MTTYINIDDEYFNPAQLVHFDLDHKDTHYKAAGRSGVLLTLPDGSVRYFWDEKAEAIRDFFQGGADCYPRQLADGLRVLDVYPAPPKPEPDERIGLATTPAMLAAIECQAAIDAYEASEATQHSIATLTDALIRHGWMGGGYAEAREFARRMVAEAHRVTHPEPATAETTA